MPKRCSQHTRRVRVHSVGGRQARGAYELHATSPPRTGLPEFNEDVPLCAIICKTPDLIGPLYCEAVVRQTDETHVLASSPMDVMIKMPKAP